MPLEFLRASLLQQRDRWVLWTPAALGLGVGGYFSLSSEPPLWTGIAALGLLLALIAFFYKNRMAVLVWLPFFLVALGFAAAQARTWLVAEPLLAYKTRAVFVQGRVTLVEDMPQGFRFVMDSVQYPSDKRWPNDPKPAAVRLTSRVHEEPPHAGDIVRVRAVLLPLSAPVTPGAYDFQRKSFFDGIGSTGYTLGHVETLTPREDGHFFATLRRYIHTHINAAIADSDAADVTAGILIGESKGISAPAWDNIRLSGLAHLLAIAGLHTGAVTGWLFFLVRYFLAAIPPIALRWPVKKISAGISFAGAIFYLYLVNFFLPAERAVIMVCVVMTAIIMDRDPFSPRLLAFAAAFILLFRPESLVGVSFQMSFGAVGMLIAFYEGTRAGWQKLYQDKRLRAKLALLVLGSMATTGTATLGTAPFSLFHFLRVPLLSGFIANLLAVPITVFVVLPLGAISCFLMPLGLDAIPLKLVGWSVLAILKIADVTAHWSYAAYHASSWPSSLLLLISAGGLWLCIWRGRIRWLGLLPVLVAVVLIPFSPRADVLVSGDGRLLAVRGDNGGLLLSPGRADKFTRNAWIEREGEEGATTWPEEYGPHPGVPVSCDADACLYKSRGHIVSFVKSYFALAQDCPIADIVITPLYVRRELCPAPALLIDKKALKYGGTHALYFEKSGAVTVKTVNAARGQRPWTGGGYFAAAVKPNGVP